MSLTMSKPSKSVFRPSHDPSMPTSDKPRNKFGKTASIFKRNPGVGPGLFRGSLSQSSSFKSDGSSAVMSTSSSVDSEELDSYGAFLQVLQREVSNDHVELWRSFRSLFSGHRSETPRSNKRRKKRIRFDSETQKLLTDMTLHLRRVHATVECTNVTQLVGDRSLGKTAKKRSSTTLPTATTKPPTPKAATLEKTPTTMPLLKPTKPPPPLKNTREITPDAEPVETTKSTKSELERQKSWLQSYRERKQPAPPQAQFTITRPEDHQVTKPSCLAFKPWKKTPTTPNLNPPCVPKSPLTPRKRSQPSEPAQETTAVVVDASASPKRSPKTYVPKEQQKRRPPFPTPSKLRTVNLLDVAEEKESNNSKAVPWSTVTLKTTTTTSTTAKPKTGHVPPTNSNPWSQVKLKSDPKTVVKIQEPPVVASPPVVVVANDPPAQVSSPAVVDTDKPDPTSSTPVPPKEPVAPLMTQKPMSYHETPKKTKKNKQPIMPFVPPSASKEPPPFIGIQLRSGNGPQPPRPLSKPEAPAPWSVVKLRKTQVAEVLEVRVQEDEHPQLPLVEESPTVETDVTVATEETEATPETKEDEEESQIAHKEPQVTTTTNEVDAIECLVHVGDEVDINNVPEAFGPQESLVIVGVKSPSHLSSTESERIICGKEVVAIVRCSPMPRARIVWRMPRQRIESLSLDMAENKAVLALPVGSKTVWFENATDCLLFANGFYQTSLTHQQQQQPPAPTVQPPTELPALAVPAPETTKKPEDSGIQLDQALNEEEQQLLARYRKVRRSKGRDVAMRETIGNEDDASSSAGGLTEEEEKIATKFRKMLKFNVPPEAVRHKMAMEGVDAKIVSAVLDQKEKPAAAVAAKKQSSLSPEDEKVAAGFRKMLKLRIPPEAVRHKMMKEQVSQKIMDAVLTSHSEAPPPTPSQDAPKKPDPKPQSDLTPEEQKVMASYKKMLKMMIPAEAVRHKMKKDQVSTRIIFAVFPDEKKSEADSSGTALSAKEEEVATKFRKMLKMRIPPEAVRHKMQKEGVDGKIVAAVLGPDPNEKKTAKDTLTPDEQKLLDAYRKMLKMKIPEQAVRHKMMKDGAAQKLVDLLFGSNDAQPTKKPKPKKSKLVSLHWTPLSGEELNKSIWRANKKRKVSTLQTEGIDISKLIELFQKKTNAKGAGLTTTNTNKGDGKAKLIDLNRANNVAISLKAFKDFSHKELAEIIDHMDPLCKIQGERVHFVKDLLPTLAEANAVKAYKGEDSRLVPAELFFREIVHIKRIETKVQILRTMETYAANAVELEESFRLLANACIQVQRSVRLQDLLDMVLHVGNIMNEGTRTGGAAGFKFESLLKLTQTKSADGKTTVLDYLVMIFVAKEQNDTLLLLDEMPDCAAGGRMLLGDLISDVKAMSDALAECKAELKALEKETTKKPSVVKKPPLGGGDPRKGLFAAITACGAQEAADPRAGLFAAIKSRGSEESQPTDARGGLLAAIKSRGSEESQPTDARGGLLAAIKSRGSEESQPTDPRGGLLAAIKSRGSEESQPDPRGGLLAAIKSRGSGEEKKKETPPLNPRAGMLAAIKAKYEQGSENGAPQKTQSAAKETKEPSESSNDEQKEVTDSGSKGESNKKSTIGLGIARLRSFVAEAEDTLAKLKSAKDNAVASCKALSEYCGESGGERAAGGLLSVLSEFASNLQTAVQKYERRMEAEAKREAANKRRNSAPGFTTPPPKDSRATESAQPGSLVLMVNEMLQKASPRAKVDFSNGVNYDNPDHRLKAIYQKEQQSMFTSPKPSSNVQTDILSCIKQRRKTQG